MVTGLGMVSPAGIGVAAGWERIGAGCPTAAADPALAGLPVDFSCRVPDFAPRRHAGLRQAWRYDRFTHLALAAVREAVADAGLDPEAWDGTRVAVVLGSAAGGVGTFEAQHATLTGQGAGAVSPMLLPMFLPDAAAGQVGVELHATGPNLHTATACASGATAIGTALRLLRAGDCDIALAGGAEAMITPLCVAAFAKMGALARGPHPAGASRPFDSERDGFVIGEGAAVLVLERTGHARARGARAYAELAGYGASADGYHATAPDPYGMGAERAIRAALADAGATPSDVDHVNAHGTGTPVGDLIESQVIERVIGERAAVTSVKGVTGHTLGAAGAIEAVCTVLALEHGLVPPTANHVERGSGIAVDVVAGEPRKRRLDLALSDSFGFGGHNAVLAFRAP